MKNGSKARLVPKIIEGEIAETRWSNERDCKEFLLRWADADGSAHERWFLEAELEEVAAA